MSTTIAQAANSILKIAAFVIVAFLVLVCFSTAGWRPSLEADFLTLILVAYTLLLVLPFSKFKLSISGFEGELRRLTADKNAPSVETGVAEKLNKELDEFARGISDPDLTLMKISIEIETTLRDIAESLGLKGTKTSMSRLIDMLRQKEILTDAWMLDALGFFRNHRNELIHEGKTEDIKEAIKVGKTVLARLRQIQKETG